MAQEAVKHFSHDKKHSDKKKEDEESQDDNDLYYYSKEDKTYRVFNPKEKIWITQDHKPSE